MNVPISVESDRVSIPADSEVVVEPTCPQGLEVLGGGFKTLHGNVNILAAFPSSDRRFTVRAANASLSKPARVKGYATCVSGARIDTSVVSGGVQSGHAPTFLAQCPNGSTRAGGGVSANDPPQRLLRSGPGADGAGIWAGRTKFEESGSADTHVYARCDRAETRYQASLNSRGFTGASHVQTRCRRPLIVAGGGFRLRDHGSAHVESSYPKGHEWHVRIDNTSASTRDFAAYAVCVLPGDAT